MNHTEQCKEILRREPKELCELKIDWPIEFGNCDTETQLYWLTEYMKPKDFILENYESHPAIKGKMAI